MQPKPTLVLMAVIIAAMTMACPRLVDAAGKDQAAIPSAPFDDSAISRAVGQIAAEIRMGYVFPDKGNRAADAIEKALAAKAYAGITDPRAFAQRLTADLQAITGDSHMRVISGSPFPPQTAKPAPMILAWSGWIAWRTTSDTFG